MKFLPIAAMLMLVGCAFLTPSHTADILQIAACVLDESSKVAPHRFPTVAEAGQIATKCGAENAEAVVDLVRMHRVAASREALRGER